MNTSLSSPEVPCSRLTVDAGNEPQLRLEKSPFSGTSEGPLTNANSTLQYTDATAVQHKKTISQKFPIMPFSARALEEKRARLGLVECMNHELLQPYPVLHEKQGDFYCTHQIHDHIETSDDFDRKSKGHTGIFGLQDVES